VAELLTDVQLTKQVCALLGEIDGWEWRETGPAYSESVVGVHYGAIKATPSRGVGVRVYLASDDLDESLSWRRMQIRFRGPRNDPTGADALADAAFARLQGLSRVGGISGISRLSMAPLGADGNGREERAENYQIILDNPEAEASEP